MVKKKAEKDKKMKITLSVDRNIFKKFRGYCESKGMKISSKVELMMREEV